MGEPIKLADGRIAYGQEQAKAAATQAGAYHADVADLATKPEEMPEVALFDWAQVKGVSTEISRALNYMGLTSPSALLAFVTMTGGDLTDIPGIGKARAAAIVEWAEDQL